MIARRLRRPVWIGALAVTALLAAGIYLGSGKPRRGLSVHTLAVLPFKPLHLAERDESLELGMTESMIASLGGRGGLAVSPLSSVRRYGGIGRDPTGGGRHCMLNPCSRALCNIAASSCAYRCGC